MIFSGTQKNSLISFWSHTSWSQRQKPVPALREGVQRTPEAALQTQRVSPNPHHFLVCPVIGLVQKDSFIKPAFPLASAISLTATGSSRFSFPHLPSPSVFCGVTFQLTSGGFSRGNVARKRNRTLTDTKTSEACVAAGSSTYRPPSCSQEGVSPQAAGREPLAAGLRCECSPCLVPEAHLQVSLSKSPATALSCDTNEASQVVIVTRDLSPRV